jgi:hypothetical protein
LSCITVKLTQVEVFQAASVEVPFKIEVVFRESGKFSTKLQVALATEVMADDQSVKLTVALFSVVQSS